MNTIDSTYDLELDKAISTIKKQKAKSILLQLPDGLKPKATEIAKILEKQTKANIMIWFGSCYGACDIPQDKLIEKEVDLIIQFGHSAWNYNKKDNISTIK